MAKIGTFRIFCIVFVLVALRAGLAYSEEAALAGEAPLVKAIEFKGLHRVQEGAVRSKLLHSEGSPLDFEKVPEDIKAIYGMGYFEDVRVESEPFEGGIKLIYALKEKPTITRVDFRGNEEIEDQKLREAVTVSPGSSADIIDITEGGDKIYGLYEKDGYASAAVVPVMRKISEDSVFLTYQVVEGEKVKIKDITIKGNKEVPTGDIKGEIKTSSWWFLSYITRGGRYEREKINADVERVRDLYFDRGYVKAEVYPPKTELSEDKKWMGITLEVNEGERFFIDSIGLAGQTVFGEEDLRKKIKSEPGTAVSMKVLREDVSGMSDMYTERGYATVSIYPDFLPTEDPKKLNVVFRVREGDVYSIGRVDISGNLKTRDKVIRREVLLNEGDTFNSKLLRRSYLKINNLNLFEAVEINPELRPEEKAMDLGIEVKERPSGSLSVGGGYSSVDKLVGMVDLTEGNLGGRGQYVKLRAELGGRSTTYELSFRDPWFLDYPVSFNASVYNTRREFVNYERKATGFSLGFGKRFLDYWGSNVSYNFEQATIFDVLGTASSAIKSQEGTRITSSVSPSLSRDSRDNNLDPHTGSSNSLFLTYAGVGGDNRFVKAAFDTAWFFPVSKRTTFSVHGNYGYATGLFGEELPLYERYYVGGIYSVRGFGFGEAGPRDESGAVIGGTRKVIFNAEYTFPLISEAGLKGVVFYDAGTAYDHQSDIRVRQSAGGGIRWLSPIGPLRLEWGYNLNKQPEERKSRWEFTFGTFF